MRRISPRESRLLAVLGLVLAIALVQLIVIAPLLDGFAARAQEREALRLRHAANARLIAAVPRLGHIAEGRRAALGAFLLSPADGPAASEFLRARMQQALAEAGGEYRGGEDLAGSPGVAGARLSARVSAAQLAALLALLQNSRPAITVTALSASADDALVTGNASSMDIQLEATLPYRAAAAR